MAGRYIMRWLTVYVIFIEVEQPGLHTIEFSMREDGLEFDK